MDTFSWLQGQLYPGAAILQFNPISDDANEENTKLEVLICRMHNQLSLYIGYGIAAVTNIILIILVPLRWIDKDQNLLPIKGIGCFASMKFRIITFLEILVIMLP